MDLDEIAQTLAIFVSLYFPRLQWGKATQKTLQILLEQHIYSSV